MPFEVTAEAERSASSKVLRQQARSQACANRTRRHYGHPPVVTTRELLPADKDLRWLAQMWVPSDGLPARQNRRPCNAICSLTDLPWQASSTRAHAAHQRALDNSSTRCDRFQQDAPIGAKNGCSRGNQQWWIHCTIREWCPESLRSSRCASAHGRTETLT
jgi:hypothetical protein